jgi:hypothetical protein
VNEGDPVFDDPSGIFVKLGFPVAELTEMAKGHPTIEQAPAPPKIPADTPEVGVEPTAGVVVDRVANFMERFVFLKTKSNYKLLALWVIATHMYADFEYIGYIFACSPEPQSGKSRLLEILDLLVAHSSGILVSPSEAVLFRTAHGHTQLLDEVDGWTNREFLRSVLNAGFHRGATVKRVEKGANGFEPRSFPVFAPRALAGIGNKILDPTTRDRTFMIEMVRQTQAERREKFRARVLRPETEQLKAEIAKWVTENRRRIVDEYESASFPYLQDFRDRTMDVTEPLAAVLEVAYAKSPALERAMSDLMEAVALARKDQASLADDHRILQALAELATSEDPLVGNATELTDRCAQHLGEKPESLDVSGVLRRYGFETKSIRKDGGDPKYRYSLPLGDLAELLARYGSTAQSGDEGPERGGVSGVGGATAESNVV